MKKSQNIMNMILFPWHVLKGVLENGNPTVHAGYANHFCNMSQHLSSTFRFFKFNWGLYYLLMFLVHIDCMNFSCLIYLGICLYF